METCDTLFVKANEIIQKDRHPNNRALKRILDQIKKHCNSFIPEMQKLSQRNDLADQIIHSASEAIIVMDSTDVITHWNNAAENLLGYKANEMIGEKFHLRVMPVSGTEFSADVTTSPLWINENITPTQSLVKTLNKKDNQRITVELSVSSAETHKGPCTICVVRGSTQESKGTKSLMLKLVQSKNKAEKANHAKSKFVAHISHELRTPLNAIIGFSEILMSEVTDNKHKSYLNTILESSGNLLGIINDLLDASKIQAGKIKLAYSQVNIYEMIHQIISTFETRAADKDIGIYYEIDDTTPNLLILDELRIKQVLNNLLSNAIRHTDNGHVELSVHCEQRKGTNKIDLVINVADTGIGISNKEKKHLFEAFYQCANHRTTHNKGTGLGLNITKELVEMMNGSISFASQTGKGSIFKVKLLNVSCAPVHQETNKVVEARAKEILFEPSNILIAEDIAQNMLMLKEYFRNTPIRIIEAHDGKEAVKLARVHQPDLILMDISMPEINGIDAAKSIRQRKAHRHIPIIALSASDLSEVNVHENDKLFDSYFLKPIHKQDLFKVLCKYLPHKIHDYQEKQPPNWHINDVVRTKLPKIITELENTFSPLWKQVSKNNKLQQIEAFAKKLSAFGVAHNISNIVTYGDDLIQYVNECDIAKIIQHLKKYPEITNTLKTFKLNAQ